jgi:twinkle protein
MSTVIGREGCSICPPDDTGNSDCVAIYEDGSKWCYKGGHSATTILGGIGNYPIFNNTESHKEQNIMFLQGEAVALTQRNLRKDTCERYHYIVSTYNGQPAQVANCFKNGQVVYQHIRLPNKEFTSIGNIDDADLFGMHLFGKGKWIVITEGQIDAMSVSQAFDNNWPAVSVPNGTQGALKAIRRNLPALNNFDEIILWFDSTDNGPEAMLACAAVLPIGRVRIVKDTGYKDANDMLVVNKIEEIKKAVWNAAPYRPDGILDGKQIWEMMITQEPMSRTTYPFPMLNERTRGITNGEIILIVSGTGMGKSTFARQLTHKLIKEERKVGYFGLEETPKDTGILLLGLELKNRIHIEYEDELEKYILTQKEAYDKVISPYLCSYRYMGADESLIDHIRFMVKGLECQYIIIDHIELAIENESDGTREENLSNFMKMLRKLVSECSFTAIVISQLTPPPGSALGHEDGAEIHLREVRACKAIAHNANTVIAINGKAKELERRLTVLKTRTSGRCGDADILTYNQITGLLEAQSLFKGDIE